MHMVLAHWRAPLILKEPPNPPKTGGKNFCHIFKSFQSYISAHFSNFRQAKLTKRPKQIDFMNTTIHKAHGHSVAAAGSTLTRRNMEKNTMNDLVALNFQRVVQQCQERLLFVE